MRLFLEIDSTSKGKDSAKLIYKGKEIRLPNDFNEILIEIAKPISENNSVFVSSPKELMTTQQAADYLEISRPTLIQLLVDHKIPVQMVGKHRRIQSRHILALSQNQKIMRGALLREIAAEDQLLDRLENNGSVKHQKRKSSKLI